MEQRKGTLSMSHSSTEQSNPYTAMPSYVKIIILAQAATILSFAVWMYQEYLNDIYFQEYVISLLRSNIIADALLPIVTASVFALGTFTLLGSMRTARLANKAWRLLSEREEDSHQSLLPSLEPVEPSAKPRSTSRRRGTRRPRADTDRILDSMRHFGDDRRQSN